MDRGSLGLAPTSPLTTMRALLITAYLLANVPSAEALSSLPSISSSAGIAMAVVAVAAALALVAGIAFFLKRILAAVGLLPAKKNKEATQENVEAGQPADEPELSPLEKAFNKFLQKWKKHSLYKREEFINSMIKEFPTTATPSMAMDVLQKMLSVEVDPDLWMRMLRFVLMLERDLFHWDQDREGEYVLSRMRIMPKDTHLEFQLFLLSQANEILGKVGDEASPDEEPEAGFMRFIAFLFGFVARDGRILQVMADTWSRVGFAQTDASRAMVWGYMRFKEDPRYREQGCAPSTESNGQKEIFSKLMTELIKTVPEPRPDTGSKAQHLLFALGCGYEPAWNEGPLAYMTEVQKHPFVKQFNSTDYLWLMMARDFVMGNARLWMCDKELSEHKRMCDLFGQYGELYYDTIVDMVMKYDPDHYTENAETMESLTTRYYESGVLCQHCLIGVKLINFKEHRDWYDRYKREQKAVGHGIYAWLMRPTPC